MGGRETDCQAVIHSAALGVQNPAQGHLPGLQLGEGADSGLEDLSADGKTVFAGDPDNADSGRGGRGCNGGDGIHNKTLLFAAGGRFRESREYQKEAGTFQCPPSPVI